MSFWSRGCRFTGIRVAAGFTLKRSVYVTFDMQKTEHVLCYIHFQLIFHGLNLIASPYAEPE
jgi:hypothetical protein